MRSIEERRIFLIVTPAQERVDHFSDLIQRHINHSVVFTAKDESSAIFKAENYPPNVLIVDSDLHRHTGVDLVERLLRKEAFHLTSFVLVGEIPEEQIFVDQVVTGQVQFLRNAHDDSQFNATTNRALNFSAKDANQEYRLRFLGPKDILFRFGEVAESVFIVKKGELEAFVNPASGEKFLGKIQEGEFVGEMAHLNHEPRSATVRAVTDCELIEIPIGKLDLVLFSKPAWAKALVQTLSRRLKDTNERLVRS